VFEKPYDVVVAGAGVAGVAAAIEAARCGASVALVEKTVFTGGLATAGLVNIYLPLCDGNGTQVSFGLAEEMLWLSVRYGPGSVPSGWRRGKDLAEAKRFCTSFAPMSFALALDEILVAEGIHIWLDTLVVDAVVESGRVRGIEVENKSGRGRLDAGCVIDATGDADVAFRAGVKCFTGENWLSQWLHTASMENARRAVDTGDPRVLTGCRRLGSSDCGPLDGVSPRRYRGTEGREVTEFLLDSRQLALDHYRAEQEKLGPDGRKLAFPLALPSMGQFRTTRGIVGRLALDSGGQWKSTPDSVGLVADWRKPGHVWEIPYGALVPEALGGLLAAGRCISSRGDAWEVTRVIPAAAVTGQASGAAAALAVRHGKDVRDLDAQIVGAHLRSRKVPVHFADVSLKGPVE